MTSDNGVLALATIRRNRGISLEQIADATKISMRSLRAIEEGQFDKLPGGIYNTNYIRQYAQAIDYNESELLAYYHSQTRADGPVAERQPQASKGLFGAFRAASTAAR